MLEGNEFWEPEPNRKSPPKASKQPSTQEYLVHLLQHNLLLEKQVSKVDEMLKGSASQPLFPTLRHEVTLKELENALKLISHYEYELQAQRQKLPENTLIEEIATAQTVLQQRRVQKHRLLKEIREMEKLSEECNRQLTEAHTKKEGEDKAARLSIEVSFYKEKIKALESEHNDWVSRSKKLQERIGGLEETATKSDAAAVSILRKELASHQLRRTNESGQGIPEEIEGSIPSVRTDKKGAEPMLVDPLPSSRIGLSASRRHIFPLLAQRQTTTALDRHSLTNSALVDLKPVTKDHLRSQIKVLSKLQSDYVGKVGVLQKQKSQAAAANLEARNRVMDVQFVGGNTQEIEGTTRELERLKALVSPDMLKSKIQDIGRKKESGELAKEKPAWSHLFPTRETGSWDKEDRRFSDRASIGRATAKIVGVKIFEAQRNRLEGWQLTYEVDNKAKKGEKHLREVNSKTEGVNSFAQSLNPGDCIREIWYFRQNTGFISEVSFVSKRGIVVRGGRNSGQGNITKSILKGQDDEHIGCVYGTWAIGGLKMLGVELCEDVPEQGKDHRKSP